MSFCLTDTSFIISSSYLSFISQFLYSWNVYKIIVFHVLNSTPTLTHCPLALALLNRLLFRRRLVPSNVFLPVHSVTVKFPNFPNFSNLFPLHAFDVNFCLCATLYTVFRSTSIGKITVVWIVIISLLQFASKILNALLSVGCQLLYLLVVSCYICWL